MTFRAYLTLLRPVRTFLFAAFYTWALGFNLLKAFGGVPTPEAALLTCTLLGPVTFGAFLLGPLHEVMHRSFAAHLPGVRSAFRRWHLVACGVAAVVCFTGAEMLGLPFPRAASAGLILAGLSAPLLNRRRGLGWGAALGMAGYAALLALLMLPSRALVLAIAQAYPGAVLVAGTAFSAFCVQRGFSAKGLRERSRSAMVYCCLQTSLPFGGSGGFAVLRQMQAENARLLAARKADNPRKDWNLPTVGSSLRDWVAVIHHCRFGGVGRSQLLLGLVCLSGAPLVCLGVLALVTSRAEAGRAPTYAQYVDQLAAAFQPGTTAGLIATLLYLLALLVGLVAAASFAAPAVLAPHRLPLSRQRLARGAHCETLRITGLVAVAFAAELALLAVGATLLAGDPFEANVLVRPLAATFLFLPAALLVQAFLYRAAHHYWILITGLAVPTFIAPGIIGGITARLGARASEYSPVVFLDAVLTPGGVAILLTLTSVAVTLHWLAVRHHFRICDFSRPILQLAVGRTT